VPFSEHISDHRLAEELKYRFGHFSPPFVNGAWFAPTTFRSSEKTFPVQAKVVKLRHYSEKREFVSGNGELKASVLTTNRLEDPGPHQPV
jgi:hypothetical protein